MPLAVIISAIPFVCVLYYAFALFDRLLRAEYQEHRQIWEADGRPSGFFWRAQECDFLRSQLSRMRLSALWLCRTPEWIAGSESLTICLRRLRQVLLIWCAGMLFWVILFRARFA